MSDKEMQKMFGAVYEDSKEDNLRSMLKDFYNRKMLAAVVLVWTVGVAMVAAMVFCGIRFFSVESVRSQIMYGVVFVCLFQLLGDLKIFAWLMMHRNSIKREIKRLELRIAEMGASAGDKR